MYWFIIIFTLATAVLNIVPFYILSLNLPIFRNIYAKIIILIFICLPFLSRILENKLNYNLAKILWFLSYTWIGFIFYLFIFSIFLLLIIVFIKNIYIKQILSILTIVISFTIITFGYINAKNIKVTKYTLFSPKIKNSYNLLFISDIHLGIIPFYNILEKAQAKIEKIKPDLIILGGDIFNDHPQIAKDKFFKWKQQNNYPIIAILGNHEYYFGLKNSLSILKEAKIKLLINNSYTFQELNFLGANDPAGHRKKDLDFFYNGLKELKKDILFDKYNILLTHRPWGFKEFSIHNNIDLQLSGHTHKGQLYPFYYLVKKFYPYIYGKYEHQKTHLIVSSGLGTWGPPLKILSPAEIVHLTILPKK